MSAAELIKPTEKLAIVGYSGHAYVVLDSLQVLGVIPFGYCDRMPKVENPYHLRYLGSELELTDDSIRFFVCIGDRYLRRSIVRQLSKFHWAGPLIDPRSVVSPKARFSPLTYVAANATVQAQVYVGTGCIINTAASIDHDCIVGDFTHIAPQATLTGNVHVGQDAIIGAGAVVLPGIRVGDGSRLGAGAVLTRDLPAGETWVGNPARPLIRQL